MEIREQTLTDRETINPVIKRKSGLINNDESRNVLMDFVESEVSKKFEARDTDLDSEAKPLLSTAQNMRIDQISCYRASMVHATNKVHHLVRSDKGLALVRSVNVWSRWFDRRTKRHKHSACFRGLPRT